MPYESCTGDGLMMALKRRRILLSLALFSGLMMVIHFVPFAGNGGAKRSIGRSKEAMPCKDCKSEQDVQANPNLAPVRTKVKQDRKVTALDSKWESHLNKDTKVLLLYTSLFHARTWQFMKGEQTFKHFYTCRKHKNCLVTYDMAWLKKAHASVFHARNVEFGMYSYHAPSKLKEVRKHVPQYQRWIFLSHENPKNATIYQPYDGLFNWTATFDRNSDIFIPYTAYRESEKPRENTRNYAQEKTGLVAWAVSNCGLLREEYALELEKYIDITVYGRCRTHFKKQRDCKHFDDACNKELSTYKFYLAFENDFCRDYVTEKYWERIQQEVVPIVMGANYDKGLVIPGSYIDVSDFDSIQKLAEYLRFLDKNDDEYNKYFSYKSKYETYYPSFYCRMCASLHDRDPKVPTQAKLSEMFNYKKNCGAYKSKADKLRKQIEESKSNSSPIIKAAG